jgi:general secretion pathway protein M
MRVIRIIRTPRVEAAIARFDAWWSERSRRERIMLTGLAVLLAAIVFVFGIIGPLQNARARAFADIRTYETINARLRAAGPLAVRPAPARTGQPSQVISESAASFGLSPRVDPAPGGFTATLADAPYESVIAWLGDIGTTSRLRIRRVTLKRGSAAGHVSATIGFGT